MLAKRVQFVLIALLGLIISGCEQVRLDERLCPIGKTPSRTTILLLDTSDPLSVKHLAELQRLLKELQIKKEGSQASHFYVDQGELLVVYELTENLEKMEPVLEVCNPGNNPDDWDWKDDLTKGKQIAIRDWRKFEDKIEMLFEKLADGEEKQSSPILEQLGVILPKYVPSKLASSSEGSKRSHLILFSDLLQHSKELSHYGQYPTAKQILTTPGLRSVAVDFTGIDFSIFRLERAQSGRWQTVEHYYWWTELVQEFGGKVLWQDSI